MTASTTTHPHPSDRAQRRAAQREAEFRRQITEREKMLERQRIFAFRRFNLMREVADAVASAESEQIAVAAALTVTVKLSPGTMVEGVIVAVVPEGRPVTESATV